MTSSALQGSADPRANALARTIYYQLKDRAPIDQVLVYRALRERLANDVPADERQDRALRSVQACARDLELALPSKKAYVRWRDAQPDPNEYLSDKAIRNAFAGSWRTMLQAAGAGVTADPGSLRLLAQGSFDSDTLLKTIAAWYDAIGGESASPEDITQENLLRWMDERRAVGDRPDLDLPRDKGVWVRHFGGWTPTLATAGLLAHRARSARARVHGSIDDDQLEAQLHAGLQRALTELHGIPSSRTFDRWVTAHVQAAAADNRLLPLHLSAVYRNRYGSWARGLYAAGVVDEAEMKRRERRRHDSYADDEVLECIDAYLAAAGPGITGASYVSWRTDELIRREANDDFRPIPGERFLRGRFGSLADAERHAAERPPRLGR